MGLIIGLFVLLFLAACVVGVVLMWAAIIRFVHKWWMRSKQQAADTAVMADAERQRQAAMNHVTMPPPAVSAEHDDAARYMDSSIDE